MSIEQQAYDISEKMNASEVDELMTYLKLIRHGMMLAGVQPKSSKRNGLVLPDEEEPSEPAPVRRVGRPRGRPAGAGVAKMAKAKAATPPPEEDNEDVF